MTAIKAIETQYKGYRFRSRTEARWAVFFDALGVEWEYEREGYDLGEAGWYLPDFWLPLFNCFAEVKPERFSKEEYDKAMALPNNCLLLDGIPSAKNYPIIPLGPSIWGWVGQEADGRHEHEYYLLGKNEGYVNLDYSLHRKEIRYDYGEGYEDTEGLLARAIAAARSARFEHGERPY